MKLKPASVFKSILVSASILSITIAQTATVSAQTNSDWYMAGANPERSGWVSQGVLGNKSVDWYVPIEAYIPDYVQLVAANDLIYVATARGLYALEAATGNVKWRYDTELPIGHSPTVVGDTAYFAGFDKKVHAVNALTGAPKWEFSGATAPFTANPVVADGRVYIGGRDGRFYALDTNTGNLVWQFPAVGLNPLSPIKFSPAYKNGVLYFTALDNYAYALNSANGTLKWKSANKLRGEHFQGFWPVIFGDQVVFVGSNTYRYLRPGLQSLCCDSMENGNVYTDYGAMERDYFKAKGGVNANTVKQYFTEKPWRNWVNVLSQATGSEYDPNGNSIPDDTPFLFQGTKSGTMYPPIVMNGDTLVKASMNSDGLNGYIPYSNAIGWKLGSPNQVGAWTGAAFDEPQAFSGGGNLIYRSLCCFRIGDSAAFSGSGSSSYWGYWQSPPNYPDWISLERDIPDFDVGWYWYTTLGYPGYRGYFSGLNQSRSGTYSAHGNYQNPIIPYKGRLYIHRANSVIAFGDTNARTRKPNLTITAKTDNTRTPSTSELKNVLSSEVIKIINAGHLKPGYHVDASNNDMAMHPYQALFANPGDTLYTLSAVYPHIDSTTLKSQLKNYIDSQYANYFGSSMYTDIGWADGTQRAGFTIPNDLTAAFNSIGKSSGGSYPPQNIYALYQYAKNVYPNDVNKVTEIYNKAKSKLPGTPGSLSMDTTDTAYGYAAGYYGFIGLNDLMRQLTGQSTYDSATRTQAQNSLNSVQTQIVNGFNPASPYGDGHLRNLTVARNFINLTPELGNYLNTTALKTKYTDHIKDINYSNPYWLSSFFESAYQERSESLLQNTLVLLGKAYVLKENRTELYKYLDAGGFERGDLYYIQNLLAVINAPTDGSSTPVPIIKTGDINRDNKVNIIDIGIVIDNYGRSPLPNPNSDLSGDGQANIIDIGIIIDRYEL